MYRDNYANCFVLFRLGKCIVICYNKNTLPIEYNNMCLRVDETECLSIYIYIYIYVHAFYEICFVS